MAAAIPFALKAAPYAASALGGLLGKKLSGPNAQQKAGMAGTTEAQGALQGQVNPLFQQGAALGQQGQNTLGAAGSYYKNILGSRASMENALTPETSTALDYYKGAEGKNNLTLRGGARDYANAEMERQKVGQLASYLPQARASAATGAANVGTAQLGAGNAASGMGVQAGSNAGYLANQNFGQGTTIGQQQQAGGNAMGKMIFDIMKNLKLGKGPTGGAGNVGAGNIFSGGVMGF